MRARTGIRVAILVVSGLISFTLSQHVLRETAPETVKDGTGVNIHSATELLQLLPGLGDIAELSGTSDGSWLEGFGDTSIYDCLPDLSVDTVDIAPPYIQAKLTMEGEGAMTVAFGRIAPSDVQKAQDSLHKPKEVCSERASGYEEYESEGLWTFTRYPLSPLGNTSLAYKYSYKPDLKGDRSGEGRIIYAISNGWGLTAVTEEESDVVLNTFLPRILAALDKAVGTKFLR